MKTGKLLKENIDTALIPDGALAFWWIGQMGYIVKCGGNIMYFDPYLAPKENRTVPPLMDPSEASHADYVFISHDHSDHLDPFAVKGISENSVKTRFVVSRTCRTRLSDLGIREDRMILLDAGAEYSDQNITVHAFAAQHEFFDIDPVLGHPYLIYVVECGGAVILHCGDTLKWDGLEKCLAKFQIDAAFIPINGRDAERLARGCKGNMTYQEAADLAGAIRPRLTVPGHYEMFQNNSQDPQAFARYVQVKYPALNYWIGEHGKMVFLPKRQ